MSNVHILSAETPTIQQQNVESPHCQILSKDISHQTDQNDESTTPLKEAKIIFSLAIPISISSIADFGMWTTDTIFLGHLGTKQLAGAAIADSCSEIFRNFVVTPTYAITALCSQAIGSGNKHMVGYWFQLAIIICTLLSIPCTIAYYYIGNVVKLISNDDQVIQYTQTFTHVAVGFLWLDLVITGIGGLHQSLEIVKPFTIISIIFISVNIVSNQIWIYGVGDQIFDGLGFIGSPLATQTSSILMLIVMYLWCFKIKRYHLINNVWNGWSLKETILNKKRVWEFVKVVVPMTIGNAAESWGYQVVNLYAARLEPAEIASLSCTFTIWGILYAFWRGIGAAILTRVGKKIGAGNVNEAKMVSKIALIVSTTVAMTMAIFIFILASNIAMLYSRDPEVHIIMTQSVRALCVLYVIGSIGWCAMNILEAMSKNKAQSIINVLSSWFGYVPSCIYFLTGDNHKLLGVSPVACIFVVGIVVESLRTLSLWIILFSTNWEQCCIEAQDRNKQEEKQHNLENVERDTKNDRKKSIDYVNLDDEQHQIA